MDPNGEETFKFESTVVGGAIPKEYIPAVGEGFEEAAKAGILGGYPVLGVHANVYDGSYHEVDSSEMAFHIAGSMAFKDAMAKTHYIEYIKDFQPFFISLYQQAQGFSTFLSADIIYFTLLSRKARQNALLSCQTIILTFLQ